MAPVVCVITTRSGGPGAELERIRAAARAGVHLIQIRKPESETRDLERLVQDAVRAVRGTPARVLVNDRVDVALAAGAHGVHLRAESPRASRVRRMVPYGFLIGRSVHSVEEAREAARDGGVDYLVFGTVFSSSSKPGVVAAGPDALAAVCDAVPVPVLAVGGVTLPSLWRIAATGAAGFAAIGLFADAADSMAAIVAEAERAFNLPPSPG